MLLRYSKTLTQCACTETKAAQLQPGIFDTGDRPTKELSVKLRGRNQYFYHHQQVLDTYFFLISHRCILRAVWINIPSEYAQNIRRLEDNMTLTVSQHNTRLWHFVKVVVFPIIWRKREFKLTINSPSLWGDHQRETLQIYVNEPLLQTLKITIYLI